MGTKCQRGKSPENLAAPDSETVIKERQVQQEMQAIIVTGGKQYIVSEGDTLFIEKLEAEAGESVVFDRVLAIVDGENTKIGAPVVENAKVDATVVKNGRARRSVSSSTPPRRVTANVRVIVSPTPRLRSLRSASKVS